jgi:hypothetical protein
MLPRQAQPVECLPCGIYKLWKWVFRWMGYPFPLRQEGKEYAGCGCLYVAKDLWEYFKWWLNYTYAVQFRERKEPAPQRWLERQVRYFNWWLTYTYGRLA